MITGQKILSNALEQVGPKGPKPGKSAPLKSRLFEGVEDLE